MANITVPYTVEDTAIILRTCSHADRFRTLGAMMLDDSNDALRMLSREEAKQLDREYAAWLEEDAEAWWQAQDEAMQDEWEEDEPEGNYHNSYHRA